jgi:hypothetical protein
MGMPMRRRPAGRSWRILLAPLVLAAVLSGLGPARASAVSCQDHAAPQPVSPGPGNNELNGVTVLSSCDVWAVGSAGGTSGQAAEPALVEHWNGSAWTVMPSPNPGTGFNELLSVRAVSAHDIWAVGVTASGEPQTLIERYTGFAWNRVPAPTPGVISFLTSVRPVSATDVWAVGEYNNTLTGRDKSLVLRWNGAAWKQMASPNPAFNNSLTSVAATSSHDVWVAGSTGSRSDHSSALIEHWNGHQWRQPTIPHLGTDSRLLGVGVTSPSSAWAVGFYRNASTTRPLLLHWNGKRWRQAASPPGLSGSLAGVYAISARNVWAAGAIFRGKAGDTPLLLHWNGSRWALVSRPGPGASGHLFAVAANSAQNIWSVGSFRNPDDKGDQALAIRCR